MGIAGNNPSMSSSKKGLPRRARKPACSWTRKVCRQAATISMTTICTMPHDTCSCVALLSAVKTVQADPCSSVRRHATRSRMKLSRSGGPSTNARVIFAGTVQFPPRPNCTAEEAYTWTDGRACLPAAAFCPGDGERVVSHFPARATNAYIFPSSMGNRLHRRPAA